MPALLLWFRGKRSKKRLTQRKWSCSYLSSLKKSLDKTLSAFREMKGKARSHLSLSPGSHGACTWVGMRRLQRRVWGILEGSSSTSCPLQPCLGSEVHKPLRSKELMGVRRFSGSRLRFLQQRCTVQVAGCHQRWALIQRHCTSKRQPRLLQDSML